MVDLAGAVVALVWWGWRWDWVNNSWLIHGPDLGYYYYYYYIPKAAAISPRVVPAGLVAL